MQAFLNGFCRVKQKRDRGGLSGNTFPVLRTGGFRALFIPCVALRAVSHAELSGFSSSPFLPTVVVATARAELVPAMILALCALNGKGSGLVPWMGARRGVALGQMRGADGGGCC